MPSARVVAWYFLREREQLSGGEREQLSGGIKLVRHSRHDIDTMYYVVADGIFASYAESFVSGSVTSQLGL